MALTALGIFAGLAGAGSTAYAASKSGDSGGGSGGAGNRERVSVSPPISGLQSYVARLLANNVDTAPTSFADYVKSGGKATFDLKGAGQFTPPEAERLGFVGRDNQPMPWYDPTQQNRLTDSQALFIGADRLRRRRQGNLSGPMTPAEQLAFLDQKTQRKERNLRRGEMGGRRAIRVANRLAAEREQMEKLRAQLFGAPNTPGPWQYDANITGRSSDSRRENEVAQQVRDYLMATGEVGDFGDDI